MTIEFQIQETLQEVYDSFNSIVGAEIERDTRADCEYIYIIDESFPQSRACAEVYWNRDRQIKSIDITTAWSDFRYSLRTNVCDYTGAYAGFMEQNLLPTFSPLLESVVVHKSQLGYFQDFKDYILLQHKRRNALRPLGLVNGHNHPTIIWNAFRNLLTED
jgi:hypothetical protein